MLMVLYLSFYFVLLESARVYGLRGMANERANLAIDSVMAQWNRQLYEQYGIYVLDTGYGSNTSHLDIAQEQFLEYVNHSWQRVRGMDFFEMKFVHAQIQSIDYATDAIMFRNAIYEAGQEWSVDDWIAFLMQYQDLFEREKEGEILLEQAGEQYENYERQNELREEMQEKENKEIRKTSSVRVGTKWLNEKIMSWLIPNSCEISEATIQMWRLPSRFQASSSSSSSQEVTWWQRVVLYQYVFEHFKCFENAKNDSQAMKYQIEYLLYGNNSDKENLAEVAKRLVMLRTALNLTALCTSAEMKLQAESFAELLVGWNPLAVTLPAVTLLVESGWAFGEAICDVQALFSGRQVPALKEINQWQLSLEGALAVAQGDNTEYKQIQEWNGLTYQQYLMLLVSLQDINVLTFRMMDMMQDSVQQEASTFYFENGIFGIEVESLVEVRTMFQLGVFVESLKEKFEWKQTTKRRYIRK